MFTHLHVHTEYSLLDGLSRLGPLVHRARELGMDSLAITDHGGLYGAIDFYRIARQAGIKPIIGCEIYVAPGSRHVKSQDEKTPYHLTVLARDIVGYRNLVKLVTAAHLEGFYYRARVDRELLEKHREGLIVLSGCPTGEVPKLITQGRTDEARAAAGWYREVFGDYFLELMSHGDVEEIPTINAGLMELNRDLGIPVVATNDSHYVRQEDAPLQDILTCIQTNTNIQDERRLRMAEDSYYLKSQEEMSALFPELPEAISNTQLIADMCDLELDFSRLHLPRFTVPDGLTADEYLARICEEGLRRRLPDFGQVERSRLEYELDVIKETLYADYILVVWDISQFVHKKDIAFAVRGSAAASLVLYCLGVTDVNPLTYTLVFERFLNVERKEMPDVDMDFQDDRREEVLSYVVSKYGPDHVAQIITFGTLGAKASIRDVGRALAMPYAEVDSIARLVPNRLKMTLDDALASTPQLQEMYEADAGIEKLVDTARALEGITRHSSTHAAGVVISQEPLDTFVPLQRTSKGVDQRLATTQYAMEPVEALGLLKLDFLGLANLTIMAGTRDLIATTRGVHLDLRELPPLDDRKTFDMLSRGDTAGVFQLEGSGMTRYIKELKPSSLADLAAMIALYRPGPMEHIGTFIEAKHGRKKAEYIHPALKDILEETYGVIVYQDQVLLIVQAFAGYSLGEADIVRKAMGKKIPEIMAKERQKFIEGALGQGHSRELAQEVFALIEPFAGYAFNKAHSVSYSLISYWTAYLKANFPEEYMVCLLNAYVDNTDKLASAVAECRRLKIPVLPPDVNHSQAGFCVETQDDGPTAVRFGLAAIKNVGAAAVGPISEARDATGPFQTIEQMCRAADISGLNSKALESLIKVGAFDTMGPRGALVASVKRILALAQSEARMRDSNQASMFDLFGESVPTPLSHIELPEIETPTGQEAAWELELLGVEFLANNPLHDLAGQLDADTIVSRVQIGPEMVGKKIVLVGQVSAASQRLTREQKPFTIATLKLMEGSIDILVWENRQEATAGLWEVGRLLTVAGSVRARGDQVSVSCLEAWPYPIPDRDKTESANGAERAFQGRRATGTVAAAPFRAEDSGPAQPAQAMESGRNGPSRKPAPPEADKTPARSLTLRIRETDDPLNDRLLLEDVSHLLLEYQGRDSVSLEIAVDGRIVTLEWPSLQVNICPELEDGLRGLLGPAGGVLVGDGAPAAVDAQVKM